MAGLCAWNARLIDHQELTTVVYVAAAFDAWTIIVPGWLNWTDLFTFLFCWIVQIDIVYVGSVGSATSKGLDVPILLESSWNINNSNIHMSLASNICQLNVYELVYKYIWE